MNKKMNVILLAIFIFTIFTGAVLPFNASTHVAAHAPGFEVEHSVEGHDLDLYFTVKNFALSPDHGWVVLSLDGGNPIKVFTKQKRLSGLRSGKHRVKAYLQGKEKGALTSSPIEFDVNIP
jgi:hypothetical protein